MAAHTDGCGCVRTLACVCMCICAAVFVITDMSFKPWERGQTFKGRSESSDLVLRVRLVSGLGWGRGQAFICDG